VVKVRKLSPNKKRYAVTFLLADDSEATFLVSEDLVVEYRLIPGKILEDFAFMAFKKEAGIDDVFQKALAYGLRYPQSVLGMKQYLEEKSVPAESIPAILEKLAQKKILDDGLYAKLYVQDHFSNRREGKEKIAFDLKRKGIPSDLVSKQFEGIAPKDEFANMNLLFDRKIASLKGKPGKKAMALMGAHLVAKGYDRDQVASFVEVRAKVLFRETDDETLIQKDFEKMVRRYHGDPLSDHATIEKIIRSLMNKGYSYAQIKKQIERGQSDER
jgi:regulatory protein